MIVSLVTFFDFVAVIYVLDISHLSSLIKINFIYKQLSRSVDLLLKVQTASDLRVKTLLSISPSITFKQEDDLRFSFNSVKLLLLTYY